MASGAARLPPREDEAAVCPSSWILAVVTPGGAALTRRGHPEWGAGGLLPQLSLRAAGCGAPARGRAGVETGRSLAQASGGVCGSVTQVSAL